MPLTQIYKQSKKYHAIQSNISKMNNTQLTKSQKRLVRYQIEGWLIIVFGFFGFFAWAASYPINQGVSGSGYLVTQNDKVTILSPATGFVTAIYKKSGEQVNAGDVLFELDSTGIESTARSNLESIRGIETSNSTLKTALQSRKLQISALQKQYQANQQLVDSGFASQNSLSTIQTQLALAQSEALELQSRIEQNQSKVKELNEKSTAIQIELKKQKILAPISGSVMNLSLKSAGLSITTGSEVLDIVPNSKQFSVEAKIPVEFGDRIEKDMQVDILFPTILNSNQYQLTGKLDYVSADKLTDEKTNQSFFDVKVSLNQLDPQFEKQLRAGLPAVIMVKTGPRTLLSYLIRPITDRLKLGLQ